MRQSTLSAGDNAAWIDYLEVCAITKAMIARRGQYCPFGDVVHAGAHRVVVGADYYAPSPTVPSLGASTRHGPSKSNVRDRSSTRVGAIKAQRMPFDLRAAGHLLPNGN